MEQRKEIDPQLKTRMVAYMDACLKDIDTQAIDPHDALKACATIIWGFERHLSPVEINAWFKAGLY